MIQKANYKWNRKGQVTVFIIVGIIILAISAAVFYIVSLLEAEPLETEQLEAYSSLEVRSIVSTFIESCLGNSGKEAVYLMASQGGYIYLDDPSLLLATDNYLINYADLNGVSGIYESKMETDLSRYIEENLFYCLSEFSELEKQGFTVSIEGDPDVVTELSEEYILFQLTYPLEISPAGGSKVEMQSFFYELRTDFGLMVDLSNKIATESNGKLNIESYIDSEYFVSAYPFDSSTMIYTITDEENLIFDVPLTLMFAVGNDEIQQSPKLEHISDLAIQEGSIWYNTLYAEDFDGGKLTFSSDSNKFPISKDGLIYVNATGVGVYDVTFTVEDETGLSDEQTVKVTVIEAITEVES